MALGPGISLCVTVVPPFLRVCIIEPALVVNGLFNKFNTVKLKNGMIVSNEPGYYKKGSYGIRIENLVYIKKYNKKLHFENLTLVPIEKELINYKLLNSKEKKYLNNYHKKVYLTLNPYLNKAEKNWLKSFIN